MKQIVFITVFLLFIFTGLIVDAKWIPENATPADVERLIQREKEDKEKIIIEQYRKEKAEQNKKEIINAATGETREEKEKISSEALLNRRVSLGGVPLDKKIPSGVSSNAQNQAIHGVPGIAAPEQKTSVVNNQEKISDAEKPIKIKKNGWKDWLVIGLFLSFSIGCLIFYFYSTNKMSSKTINKNTTSKGITLIEILVATIIITISILCILKAFQQSSLVQPQTGDATTAMTLCQKTLEEIRSRDYTALVGMMGTGTPERLSMSSSGIAGGATRTVIIKGVQDGTFEESASYDYLKATVRIEWDNTPIRQKQDNGEYIVVGNISLKRELSVFIAPRVVGTGT